MYEPKLIAKQFYRSCPGEEENYLKHTFVVGMAHRNEKTPSPAVVNRYYTNFPHFSMSTTYTSSMSASNAMDFGLHHVTPRKETR